MFTEKKNPHGRGPATSTAALLRGGRSSVWAAGPPAPRTCAGRPASGTDARASRRLGASEDAWSRGGHFLSGGLGSLGVVMGIITMTLPKTVKSPCFLPGTVLVALHTLRVAHLLAAEVECVVDSTGAGRAQGPVPPFHVGQRRGAAPRLTWFCSPSRGQPGWARLGSGQGECAWLGPEPCGRSQAGQPAAPPSRPVPLGRPGLGTGSHPAGKRPARAAIRWALGLGHGTLFGSWCPHGLSRRRCPAATRALPQEGGCFVSAASGLVLRNWADRAMGFPLVICEVGTATAPPLVAVRQGTGGNVPSEVLQTTASA